MQRAATRPPTPPRTPLPAAGLRSAPAGERLGWLGSWPFALATGAAVAVVAVWLLLRAGPSVAVLDVVLVGLVLVELPLLFRAVRAVDRASSGLATDQLDADRRLAGEVDELADTVARLNARLRSGPAGARRDGER
jgi:hypothetical protein